MKSNKWINSTLFITTIILISIFIFVTLVNNFPINSYRTVANRWFENYSISPPIDFQDNELREVKIDFLAPKEFDYKTNLDFYWITNTGDLLTLTNPNFEDIDITLSFDLKTDPCKQRRNIIITSQKEPIFVGLNPNEQINVSIPLKIEANKSIFLTISPNDKLLCSLNNLDKRLFLVQVINPLINYQ